VSSRVLVIGVASNIDTWRQREGLAKASFTLGLVYTMNHEVGPRKMVFFSWSVWVLNKKSIYQAFGVPSLGVNRMWTKKNDHAPKVNVLIYFSLLYVQKRHSWKEFEFDHSLVFSWASLVFTSCWICWRCGLQIFSQQFFPKKNDRFTL